MPFIFLDHTIHLEETPTGHNYHSNLLAKKRKLLFLDSGPLNQGTWCWTTVPSTIMLPPFLRCLFMSGPSGGHIEMLLCLGFCSKGLGSGMLSLERVLDGCIYIIILYQTAVALQTFSALSQSHLYLVYRHLLN